MDVHHCQWGVVVELHGPVTNCVFMRLVGSIWPAAARGTTAGRRRTTTDRTEQRTRPVWPMWIQELTAYAKPHRYTLYSCSSGSVSKLSVVCNVHCTLASDSRIHKLVVMIVTQLFFSTRLVVMIVAQLFFWTLLVVTILSQLFFWTLLVVMMVTRRFFWTLSWDSSFRFATFHR